ncbi:MAG TPA: hypothetical protein VFN67_20725 [Polyangiales bacterium]|jgi:hypothetical protein|nr:hypothetical protein [Polyangiales bacterium]
MRTFATWLVSGLLLCTACGKSGAPDARAKILHEHAPRVEKFVLEVMQRHEMGLAHAADRISAGFVKAEPAQQENEMRQVLKMIRNTKRGVPELVISPMSFLAVVGKDGKCIARDVEPDRMKGMELAKLFPVVADALQGKLGTSMGEFESEDPKNPSVTILMAAPAHYKGEVVGALVMGIPLWRLQQLITKQLQMELSGKESVVIWAYVYRGAELHHHGTPPDLDKIVPDEAARKAGYAKSPGGFTGEIQQYGYWYGYGVRPLRVLGPDIGLVLVRMQQ